MTSAAPGTAVSDDGLLSWCRLGRPGLVDLAMAAVLALNAVLVPLVFGDAGALSFAGVSIALVQTLPVLWWRIAPGASLAAHLLTKPLTLLSGALAPETVTVVLLYALAGRRSRLAAVLGFGAAVSSVLVLSALAGYVLLLVGVLQTVVTYAVAGMLGLGSRTARVRADVLLRRRERADLDVATEAQRAQIALELQDAVAGRLQRVAALALDAERAAHPAERFAAIQHQARHALTAVRRMLHLLRGSGTLGPPADPGPDALPSGVRAWIPTGGDLMFTMGALAALVALHLLLPAEPPGRTPAALWALWRLPGGALGVAAVVVQVLPLAWRRRAPAWALLVSTVGTVFAPPLAADSYLGFVSWLILVYSTAAGVGRRACFLIIPLAVAAQHLSAAVLPRPAPAAIPQTPATIVYDVLVVVALWFAGDAQRRTRAAVERARRRERAARTRRSLHEQRLRLARELHDVLAHHISVVAVQAAAARTVVDQDADLVCAMGENIRHEASTALAGLPKLISALDPSHSGDRTRNRGGLGDTDLAELVRPLRDAGAEVSIELRGDPAHATPTSSIFARRIAQEAVTNVLRHAGASRTRLVVEHHADRTLLEVSDDGPHPAHHPVLPGGGHGLLGMRERATTLGGGVEAGPRAGGGWTVRAELPH